MQKAELHRLPECLPECLPGNLLQSWTAWIGVTKGSVGLLLTMWSSRNCKFHHANQPWSGGRDREGVIRSAPPPLQFRPCSALHKGQVVYVVTHPYSKCTSGSFSFPLRGTTYKNGIRDRVQVVISHVLTASVRGGEFTQPIPSLKPRVSTMKSQVATEDGREHAFSKTKE